MNPADFYELQEHVTNLQAHIANVQRELDNLNTGELTDFGRCFCD